MIQLIVVILAVALWIFGLMDILKHEFTGANKIIWLVLVFFIPILGGILYFTIGRKQRISSI